MPRHGGGAQRKYGTHERERIVAEVKRTPTVGQDGTVSWRLSMLQRSLRQAVDGLPEMSTYTIRQGLLEAGYSCQRDRTWCQTGQVVRVRKNGPVVVEDADRAAKKAMEAAYTLGERLGIQVWCEDEAGPYQTLPYAGSSWQPSGYPRCQPHEYTRNGRAKLLTLFHPATGEVRAKGGHPPRTRYSYLAQSATHRYSGCISAAVRTILS